METTKNLERARQEILPYLHDTPLIRCEALSEELGIETYVKLENLQRTGSFKVRGALWKLLDMPEDERRRGVITASAGNHARGMVYACNLLSVPCRVFVPETTSSEAARDLASGVAEPVLRGRGYDEAEEIARQEAKKRDLPFVSPFDDPWIIEGNGGTLGLEILDEAPDVDCVVAPVGGGGLLAGLGLALESRSCKAHLWGAQSEASCAMALSLEKGQAILSLPPVDTLAVRLEGGVADRTFELVRKRAQGVAVLPETEFATAVRFALFRMRLVIEPSGAAGIAALLSRKVKGTFKKIVVVASGGNIDRQLLIELLRESA